MLFRRTQINRTVRIMEIVGSGEWRAGRTAVKIQTSTHFERLNLFSVAKVIETMTSTSSASHILQKTAASIVVSTQQPLTMTTLATTVTPSSNSNLPAAVSSTPTKKQRPKTASPTRHGGPQQCQVNFAVSNSMIICWKPCHRDDCS